MRKKAGRKKKQEGNRFSKNKKMKGKWQKNYPRDPGDRTMIFRKKGGTDKKSCN